MQLKNYNVYFFFGILLGASVLSYFLLKPFIIPFIIAAVLTYIFYPFYRKVFKLTRERKGLSSTIACVLVGLIIILPVFLVFSLVINEAQNISQEVSSGGTDMKGNIQSSVDGFSQLSIIKDFGLRGFFSEEKITQVLQSFFQNTSLILQTAYRGVSQFIFSVFIMFFSLFYLFIDGPRLVKKIMEISPMRDKYEEILIERFSSLIKAILKGTFLIAIIQGALGAILFYLTGVISPALLGILMMISAFIPNLGTALVWLPVGIVMIALGNPVEGTVILIFGASVIATIDNILRPKLVGNKTQIHPLLILFSTLGGLALFGISGFIIGPIIIALFVVLWEVYSLEFKSQLKQFNK